jgi:hypothetical protein
MLSLRAHALITGAIFALIVVLAGIGNSLISLGIVAAPQEPQAWAMAIFFLLFLALGYSAIPLLLKLFVAGQARIGNGNVAVIRATAAHQTAIVLAFWAVFTAGLALAVPAAIDDGMFGPGPQRALKAFLGSPSTRAPAVPPGN